MIEVNSPYNYEYRNTNESKKRKVIDSNDKELTLDFKNEGAKKTEEIVEIAMTEHEFKNTPYIYKVPKRKVNKKSNEDENTETIVKNNDNIVSTADLSGVDGVKGLDFKELDNYKELIQSDDIAQMLKVLRVLKDNYPIIQISTSIGNVPIGKRSRLFAFLDDGITPRKYLLATIMLEDKNIRYLLEVERQGKSLSTLLIYSQSINNIIDIRVINSILKGLVDNNGSWDSKELNELTQDKLLNKRISHVKTKKRTLELAYRLYQKTTD